MTACRRLLLILMTMLLIAAPVAASVVSAAARPLDDDRYVLLVMGSDMGPWRPSTVLKGRSDALHLIVVVPSERTASILSFPRDTYVSVPGMGTTRINAALTKGPDTAVATMEAVTGLEVDDWVVTGMGAFTIGINDFGGLEVDVPQRLKQDAKVVEPGLQQLDGTDTLIFARDRKSRSSGDFGRNKAQAEVLDLLHTELVRRDPSPTELLRLISVFRRATVSSIPAARMPTLAAVAMDIDPANVRRAQVPGRNANRGGAAVVVMTDAAKALFADLRDDGMLTDG